MNAYMYMHQLYIRFHSLGIAISSRCIVQWSPVELIQTSERGSVGHEGEDTLVLGRGRGVVEGRATILVTTVDVREANHVQNHINTLNVTAVGKVFSMHAKMSMYIILLDNQTLITAHTWG